MPYYGVGKLAIGGTVRTLLQQIRAGLDANLYYLSLYVALTIPDICGALDSDNGYATAEKYKDWHRRYVAPKYELDPAWRRMLGRDYYLSPEDCYIFRNSLLHQGTTLHPGAGWERIFFVEPSVLTITSHLNVVDNALNIDLRTFCDDVITGAEQWLDEVESTERYLRNYDGFLRRHADGLAPFIVGVPIIG